MDVISAILRRDFAYSDVLTWGLLFALLLIAGTVPLWIAAIVRAWRHGQRLYTVDMMALDVLISVALLQPILSQLSLNSSDVVMAFGVLLALGAGLGVIAIWIHWRRWSTDAHHTRTIIWALLGVGLLAVSLAYIFNPTTLPLPLFEA